MAAGLERAGMELLFHKVRIKPGKPILAGRAGGCWVFGLPGNPVSCMVNFLQFVRPWIRTALGDPSPYLPVVDAVAGQSFKVKKTGRAKLQRVRLQPGEQGWVAVSTGTQSSGALSSMAWADGLLLISPDGNGPDEGDAVRVQLVNTGFLAASGPNYPW